MTKKDFIKKYNGELFKRTVTKGITVEDIPQMRKDLGEMLSVDGQGLTYKETDTTFNVLDEKGQETGQMFIKPKMEREVVGKLEFRSSDTVFEVDGDHTYGSIPPAKQFFDNYFVADYGNLVIKYEVVND